MGHGVDVQEVANIGHQSLVVRGLVDVGKGCQVGGEEEVVEKLLSSTPYAFLRIPQDGRTMRLWGLATLSADLKMPF